MKTMIALIGEQPIPNLLPIRYLKPEDTILVYTRRSQPVAKRLKGLISKDTNTILCQVDAYDFEDALEKLGNKIGSKSDLLFNLTGGTKMMALAAFAYASKNEHPFVYLKSQDHESLLFRYQFADGLPVFEKKEQIPPLITAADYLNAHLPGFNEEGFSCDDNGGLTDGGLFEEAVYNALKQEFDEVLAGVCPRGVADQIEIDLVIRSGNQVGIVEVKVGGKGPKTGLDQLQMAGGREYLGTYTTKFLITASKKDKPIRTLAQQRNIFIIEIDGYRRGRRLSRSDASRLVRTVKEKLCG